MTVATKTTHTPERIFLFHGADDYATHQKVTAWIEAFGKRHSVFGITRIDCHEEPEVVRRVLNSGNVSGGLFSSKRLLIVKHFFEQKAEATEGIIESLQNVADDTYVVFWERAAVKKQLRSYKNFEAHARAGRARIYFFDVPTPIAVERSIRQQGPARGISFAPAASRRLAGAVGSDRWRLANEIEKLAAYQLGGAPVTSEDIDALVSAPLTDTVFEFTDAFSRGDRVAALQSLEQLFAAAGAGSSAAHKARGIAIVGALAQQARSLLLVASGQQSITDSAELARVLGWTPFRLKKNQQLARRFSPQAVRRLLMYLHRIDGKLKSSSVPASVLLAQLVFF